MSASQQLCCQSGGLFFSFGNEALQYVMAIKTSVTLFPEEAIKHLLAVIVSPPRGDIILLITRRQKDNKPASGWGQLTALLTQ